MLFRIVPEALSRIMQAMHEVSRPEGVAPVAQAEIDVEGMLLGRIRAAQQLRQKLQLPSASTNVYRLINSEGDRLSGLIVDVLNDRLVVASSAAWVERWMPFRSKILCCSKII